MSTPNPFVPAYQSKHTKSPAVEANHETLAITLGEILKQVYNSNTEGYIKMLSLLANGTPTSMDNLAEAFGYPSFLLKTYFYVDGSMATNFDFDAEGKIIGMGLTAKPTKHHFTIRGNPLYTWCALDTLLFPLMLKESAQVKTPCPITGGEIAFSISPDGIQDLNLKNAVASFVIPDPNEAKENIRKSFCHFANLFKDREAATEWKAQHPQALILSIEEAFTFTQQVVSTLIEPTDRNKNWCSMQ